MKLIALVMLLVAAQATAPEMTVPKIEHKTIQRTVQDEEITVTCPEGYEGHFVDHETGFDWQQGYFNGGTSFNLGPEWGYTICFSKKFMDEIRKNQELLRPRPSPPRPI
jgi:hypothetical protein